MKYILLLALMLFNVACENKTTSNGVKKMHWDRDMCARCVMVISDRKNSVQVKIEKITYKFDDIGCMVIWAEENDMNLLTKSKIWITDAHDGTWIDAKNAFYTSGNTTPMGFGFSAYKNVPEKVKDTLSFTEVYNKIKK